MKNPKKKLKAPKFNTFSGVFVPSVLAIFGAVMYLILPRVVGGVGLLQTLLIILLAHSVSLATAFSLSAIATNIKVKGGGMYYLISRSLGSEFGGALGIQLFLAQSVAIAFYAIAFARGVGVVLNNIGFILPEVYVAFVFCLLFGVTAFIGAKFVIRIQYVILGAIILSVFSLFLSQSPGIQTINLFEGGMLPFWVAFAMFFPAVTGIDAGVGLSGDLKNPKKSLVVGTFTAIIVTMIVYIALAMKMAVSAPLEELFSNPYVIATIAYIPSLVIIGILLATASSALSYFMSSPRTLRKLAEDNIFRPLRFFAGSIGESLEPRRALIVSLIIALSVILLGGLDFASVLVTIFFLNVYGWINGAAFLEKLSGNPSYRPSFNAPLLISLYGMIICYAVMYLFNPWVMVLSIAFQLVIFYILYQTKTSIKLESVWDGVLFQFFRRIVKKIEETERSKKNWRPNVLAFCGNAVNRNIMFSLLDWISAKRGMTKLHFLTQGTVDTSTKKREQLEEDMKQYVKANNLDLYPRVIEAKKYKDAVETVLQSESIGNLPPNTALIDFDPRFELGKLIRLTTRLKKNVLILRNIAGFSDFKFVDVWWDDPEDGNLMLLLAYLITHSKAWMEKDASIRLFKIVRTKKEQEAARAKLTKLVNDSRIDNITLHILFEKHKKIPNVIREHSHYADLVLIGMPHVHKKGIYKDIAKEIEAYTNGLSTSLVVLANDKIDFRIN